MDLIDCTATELAEALSSGQVRSTRLAEQLIARTEAASSLNCYVHFDAVGLLRQAAEADARLEAGERLPLLGIPVALKDNIDVAGMPCGAGTGALHGRRPARDADVVRRLRDAGALIAGKVGMHELAMGITSNNAVTGAVRNPWEPSCIPGGSSGGSGAVVAARLVPVAIGTDTGGSVRIPAALCGVAGFRPSAGRVSGQGIAPISTTRDTAGPLARSVDDLALLDGVLAGDRSTFGPTSLRGVRLGVPRSHFWDDLSPGVRARADAALSAVREAGAEIVQVDVPGLAELAGEISMAIVLHEFVRDMGDYLESRQRGVSYDQLIAEVRSEDVRSIVGELTGLAAVPADAYRQAMQGRRRLQALYDDVFASQQLAALIFPTTPSTAIPVGQDQQFALNGRLCPVFPTFIRNTDPGSCAGIPGVSLPIGLSDGMPVGLALDGPAGSDRHLLSLARAVEALLPPMARAPFPY
ncbi:MAG: indoleacetamide hydrolase [Gammaproteobacteria bacterium]